MKRTSTEVKPCEKCGRFFPKNPRYSRSQWEKQRFCDHSCGSWNKGLTKHDDPRMLSIAKAVSERDKGRAPWNKGLTADSDARIAQQVESGSGFPKGAPARGMQKAGLEHGRIWCKGKTAKTDESLAKRGRRISEALKGRKNPEHSAFLKKHFAENPDKHPNAILAQKTRGLGYTHIERLVAEYLEELGLEFSFNRRIGRKWVDFALESSSLVVEADGEYWHTDQEAEERRDAYLWERGWYVLHLTGSQIVTDPDGCKEKITASLGDHKATA